MLSSASAAVGPASGPDPANAAPLTGSGSGSSHHTFGFHHFPSASQLLNASSRNAGSPMRRQSTVAMPRLPEVHSYSHLPACAGSGSGPGLASHSPSPAQTRSLAYPHAPLHSTCVHRVSDTASPYSLRSVVEPVHVSLSPCTEQLPLASFVRIFVYPLSISIGLFSINTCGLDWTGLVWSGLVVWPSPTSTSWFANTNAYCICTAHTHKLPPLSHTYLFFLSCLRTSRCIPLYAMPFLLNTAY